HLASPVHRPPRPGWQGQRRPISSAGWAKSDHQSGPNQNSEIRRLQSGVSREGLLSIIEVVESAAIQVASQCPSRIQGTGALQALSDARSRIDQNEDVREVSRRLVEPILALAASAEPLLPEEATRTIGWTVLFAVTMSLISVKYPGIWIFLFIAFGIAFGVWAVCWDWISQRFFQGRGARDSRPGFGR
ncbi:MAG: hypothetical protein WB347_19305, partial [Terriglobales bacterium]